tara:strand:- start:1228 stop:1584 length:357 start_codon:yes stop_codon:yes gene_type:complete
MKNLKTIIAIVAISISSVVSVAANTNTEPTSKDSKTILRTEIVSLLGNHSYDLSDKTLEAQVSVMLNNKNELIVVSVSSKDEAVAGFVKSKLNYKRVTVKGITKGTIYRIPLKMIQSS